MTSFRKAVDSTTGISGVIRKANYFFTSTGIPSLDYVIGGGLPTSSIFAVEEDVLGNYSRVLTKCFLAEGVVSKHALFVASVDEEPQKIVKELPMPCTAPRDDELPVSTQLEKMKIAWRYEGLSQVESALGNNSRLGHLFDLSKHIDSETINKTEITYYKPKYPDVKVKAFQNPMYFNLLNSIKEAVSKGGFNNRNKSNNLLRISIQSLGSPLWMAMDCEEDSASPSYGQDLIKFLYCLRILIGEANAVVFITIPSHLFHSEHLMKRLMTPLYSAVRLESFAGSSKATNPQYKDYHGLFHATKLTIEWRKVHVQPADLAFKLKRKKFVIEKLHLPPELKESSEREQDDITTTCGGFKKKHIEF